VFERGSLERRLGQVAHTLVPEIMEIGPWLEGKLAAISAYASQIDELFGGNAAMRKAVMTYARRVRPSDGEYGERLWRYATS